MRIDVFTIFPAMVAAFTGESLVGRAAGEGRLDLRVHDLRDATTDGHRSVDDSPFGGGAGMVFTPGPVFDSVEAVGPPRPLLLLGPGGRRLDQAYATNPHRFRTRPQAPRIPDITWINPPQPNLSHTP